MTPVAVAAGTARATVRPVVALQFALLASLVSNLGRIPTFSTGESSAPLMVNDVAVALVLCAGALVMVRAASVQVDMVGGAALAFAAVGGFSAITAVPRFGLTTFELLVSLAYLARWLFYFGLYLVVINTVRRRDTDRVWRALEWMLLVFAAFGIIQSIFLPGFAQMVYPDSRIRYDWDYQGHRLVSTVLEPNIAAAMLMVGLFVQLGRMTTGAPMPRWKPALLFVAMVLTLSRSGALGLIFGGFVILASRGLSRRLLRFAAAFLVAFVISLPKLVPFMLEYNKLSLGGSAAGRLVNLAQALMAFLENPVIGIGFNTFGFYMERQGIDRLGLAFQSSDGGLLFAAAMTGVVGLSCYVWMLVSVFRRCRGIWRSPRCTAEERGLAIGVAAGIVGLCVHSVFVNSLFSTSLLLPMWVLWGLTYCIGTDLRASPSPDPAPARVGGALAHA